MNDALLGALAIATGSVVSLGLFILMLGSGSRLPPSARSWLQRWIFVPAPGAIAVLWLGYGLYRFGMEAWRSGGHSWSADAMLGLIATLILWSTYELLKNNGHKLRAWLGRRPETSA
jgi:cytochrome bd-type quinol oxidase subunit 2